jgi:hypothetical protein
MKTWIKLAAEMTVGLDADGCAAVEALALGMLCQLSSPTEAETRIALAFARDHYIANQAAA